jgi:hypothetical protein
MRKWEHTGTMVRRPGSGRVRGTKNVRYVDSTDRSGRFSVNMWAWISVDCPVVILHVEERLTSAVYTLTGTKNDSL